jgi:hypothetical protein
MFKVFIDKARIVAQFLKRVRDEFAEAQQHMVPVWLTALAVASGAARWI